MSTAKLPFYEKDALRWRDHAGLVMQQLRAMAKLVHDSDKFDVSIWQLQSIMDDIDNTLRVRRIIPSKNAVKGK